MTGIRTSLKVLMRCFRTGLIVDIILVLALEVRGEHRMNSAAMNMTDFPMTMISLRVDMEQRDHEHPEGQPQDRNDAKPTHVQPHRLSEI